ncbi:MAG: hypothetical protein QM764_16245 [Chitinophagaceae bacterium]
MKRLKELFVLMLIISPCLVFSQTKSVKKTDKEMIPLLCHKWHLTHMGTQGKEKQLPATVVTYLLIKSDGTLLETNQGQELPGKWTLNHGTLSVTNIDNKDAVEKYKIISVTESELIYESNEDGTVTRMKFKREN